mmetsp:Transcript_106711/g.283869  ORF Transcript_106711/g.283869 Transcript_106711/m.283869 type:complete len:226 (+) Transcript_106711:971-1648(+)
MALVMLLATFKSSLVCARKMCIACSMLCLSNVPSGSLRPVFWAESTKEPDAIFCQSAYLSMNWLTISAEASATFLTHFWTGSLFSVWESTIFLAASGSVHKASVATCSDSTLASLVAVTCWPSGASTSSLTILLMSSAIAWVILVAMSSRTCLASTASPASSWSAWASKAAAPASMSALSSCVCWKVDFTCSSADWSKTLITAALRNAKERKIIPRTTIVAMIGP